MTNRQIFNIAIRLAKKGYFKGYRLIDVLNMIKQIEKDILSK